MDWLILLGLFIIWNSWDDQFTLMIELLTEIRDAQKESEETSTPPTNTPNAGSAGSVPKDRQNWRRKR